MCLSLLKTLIGLCQELFNLKCLTKRENNIIK